MMEMDRQRRRELLGQSEQLCGICLCSVPGHDLCLMDSCDHFYCHECIAEYCSVHAREVFRALLGPNALHRVRLHPPGTFY
jgi:hypothetical protein